MLVIHSTRSSVHENLAAEDAMLDDAVLVDPVVFIYRNDDAVVIGKNQNPWRECAVSKLHALGVALARRVSGGGAVYHDRGNVNISCIVPRDRYDRCDMLRAWIEGLAASGVVATVSGNTSLTVDGRKISGSAYCYRRDKVMHHGTVLLDANLPRMREALIPDLPDVETRAVASVPMPVANLAELRGGMPASQVVDQLVHSIASRWGGAHTGLYDPFEFSSYPERLRRMKDPAWIYLATPDFSCRLDGREVFVHRGVIARVDGEERHPWVGRMFIEMSRDLTARHT
jgi:lipoate-protein ligase A